MQIYVPFSDMCVLLLLLLFLVDLHNEIMQHVKELKFRRFGATSSLSHFPDDAVPGMSSASGGSGAAGSSGSGVARTNMVIAQRTDAENLDYLYHQVLLLLLHPCSSLRFVSHAGSWS